MVAVQPSVDEPGEGYGGRVEVRVPPLGIKPPDSLRTVFANSRYVSFVRTVSRVVCVGRAVADGLDYSYIADVAVHPDHQGHGLGRSIVLDLAEQSRGHTKIILYANPGAEAFYAKLGFLPMRTAMAIFADAESAVASGVLSRP